LRYAFLISCAIVLGLSFLMIGLSKKCGSGQYILNKEIQESEAHYRKNVRSQDGQSVIQRQSDPIYKNPDKTEITNPEKILDRLERIEFEREQTTERLVKTEEFLSNREEGWEKPKAERLSWRNESTGPWLVYTALLDEDPERAERLAMDLDEMEGIFDEIHESSKDFGGRLYFSAYDARDRFEAKLQTLDIEEAQLQSMLNQMDQ
jgi:hypothetical protein